MIVRRSPHNPLIAAADYPEFDGNVNGPSVIRTPSWLANPLGRYYLYFAGHKGRTIRLAYADDPHGPWRLYPPGTLQLDQTTHLFHDHIASPDVHIDENRRELRMYYHGSTKAGQKTSVARSSDGLHFQPADQILGPFYFRVFQYDNWYYALAKDGNTGWARLYRSRDGLTPFAPGRQVLRMARHTAVLRRNDRLWIFYSRKGDAPERILLSYLDLTADWNTWQETDPIDVLAPETVYEGVEYPITPSRYGGAVQVRQLRDPAILAVDDRLYLYYTGGGEMCIALAEVELPDPAAE